MLANSVGIASVTVSSNKVVVNSNLGRGDSGLLRLTPTDRDDIKNSIVISADLNQISIPTTAIDSYLVMDYGSHSYYIRSNPNGVGYLSNDKTDACIIQANGQTTNCPGSSNLQVARAVRSENNPLQTSVGVAVYSFGLCPRSRNEICVEVSGENSAAVKQVYWAKPNAPPGARTQLSRVGNTFRGVPPSVNTGEKYYLYYAIQASGSQVLDVYVARNHEIELTSGGLTNTCHLTLANDGAIITPNCEIG